MKENKTIENSTINVTSPDLAETQHKGSVCNHHSNQSAVATCEICGKNKCLDCAETYNVSVIVGGDKTTYKHLCYDCCVTLLNESIAILDKNRKKIIIRLISFSYIFKFFGKTIGAVVDLSIGDFWNGLGKVVACGIEAGGEAFVDISYFMNSFKLTKSSTSTLQLVEDYMKYTLIRNDESHTSSNKQKDSEPNAYVNLIKEKGELEAYATLVSEISVIKINDETIRNWPMKWQ